MIVKINLCIKSQVQSIKIENKQSNETSLHKKVLMRKKKKAWKIR